MAEGIFKLMLYLARAIFVFLGGVAGYQVVRIAVLQDWWPKGTFHFSFIPFIFGVVLFALIGYLVTPFFVRLLGFIGLSFEKNLETLSWHDISVALAGLIAGLIVANLAALPFADLPVVGSYLAVLLNVVLGYLGATLFLKRKEEIHGMWSSIGGLKQRFSIRGKRTKESGDNALTELAIEPGNERLAVKLLDTSVIIDGRILEIASTGFLEGPFILPRFILNELQTIADSSDPTRRTKGRRGLDIINELRQLSDVSVQILEVTLKDFDVGSVDEGLVALAKELAAKVVTTDYNLNKIAQIQGVSVLNVNELANALKPSLLPGESITVDVLREGKEPQQGVGYLDDGTMIVVENGEDFIGKRVEVVVTSMLQTSAGRMVFGRIRKEVRP
ncbi:MAG TPA: TRAM domain-containing protein [Synergistales bacterium]|nr:TRAM domain-containing protein [Synergistales bacterium]HPK42157.1 TRAM domain-containing protein [Synergistales bacterium]